MHRRILPATLPLLILLAGCSGSGEAPAADASPISSPTPSPSVVKVVVPDITGRTYEADGEPFSPSPKGFYARRIVFNTDECPGYDPDGEHRVRFTVDRTDPSAGTPVGSQRGVTVFVTPDCAAFKEAGAAEAAAAEEAARAERACQEARDFRDRFAGDPDMADAWMVNLILKTEDELAGLAGCEDLAADVEYSRRMIANDSYTVGVDIPAGTYTTFLGGLEDCYWERSSSTGATIANDFITFSPQPISVTVADGEGLTVDGCGLWVAPSPVR